MLNNVYDNIMSLLQEYVKYRQWIINYIMILLQKDGKGRQWTIINRIAILFFNSFHQVHDEDKIKSNYISK